MESKNSKSFFKKFIVVLTLTFCLVFGAYATQVQANEASPVGLDHGGGKASVTGIDASEGKSKGVGTFIDDSGGNCFGQD